MVIKMPSSDVAADMCSSDSLSLTGLVRTQDHTSKPQPHEPNFHRRKATKVSENDINFEFSYSAQSPVDVKLHKRSPSSDLFELKLNQRAQAHAQAQTHGNVTMKDVLEPRHKGRKPGGKKEAGSAANGGFAHKFMQSITTPCRSCSAAEPTSVSKTGTVQGV